LSPTEPTSDSLRPWQFFTLGALVCATVAVFLIRGTTPGNLIFVCLGIFGAALVALAALNALRPLVTGETRQPEMVGSHTRVALEREKNLLLRSIKELEFDHAMGKVGEDDFQDMSLRLRARAVRLNEQLDHTSSGYRELIERELAKRLGDRRGRRPTKVALHQDDEPSSVGRDFSRAEETGVAQGFSPVTGACPSCATVNDDDAKFCKSCGTKLLALVLLFTFHFLLSTFYFSLSPASAQFQMPDPKEMSGIPRPVTDLPEGHVSVRLIRGQLSNNIQGHPVEMHAGGKVTTVKTDENGRAEFSGIAAGTSVRAVATVDGERLESQEFPWPARDGIRVMLVATLKTAGGPAPVFQPQPGNVVLGDQTRVIVDHTDGALQIYYILDILNSARTPVQPAEGIVMDMPTGALSTTVLAGAPQAVARGDRVTVSGPFAPGQTPVELAYRVPFDAGEVTIEQKMPLAVPNLAVLMKNLGDMSLSSPQLPNVQEREFEGERYILAQGPAIAAGGTLSLTFSDTHQRRSQARRPFTGHADSGPGVWARRQATPRERRAQTLANRRRSFNELVRLEQQRRRQRGRTLAPNGAALIAARAFSRYDAESGQAGHPPRQVRAAGALAGAVRSLDSRTLHPRAQPQLRPPARPVARVAGLPRRRDRRAARPQRRRQVHAPGHRLDAGHAIVR
jgi:hypothetical protein